MSTATRGRHISGRSRNFGSAACSQSPRATCSQSHTVNDTTTIPTSEHPTDNNTNLSEHESTLTTDDREQEPVRKRRRLTRSRPHREKVIEEGDQSDPGLPHLELKLCELQEIL